MSRWRLCSCESNKSFSTEAGSSHNKKVMYNHINANISTHTFLPNTCSRNNYALLTVLYQHLLEPYFCEILVATNKRAETRQLFVLGCIQCFFGVAATASIYISAVLSSDPQCDNSINWSTVTRKVSLGGINHYAGSAAIHFFTPLRPEEHCRRRVDKSMQGCDNDHPPNV